jgi:hypothetical protein
MAKLSYITCFGLPGIDRIPFGTHACHLYSNRALCNYELAQCNDHQMTDVLEAPRPASQGSEAD